MPELPDVTVYIEALRARIERRTLVRVIVKSPFLLRSTAPSPSAIEGRTVAAFRRVGKRIAIGFDNGCWLALHLMIAGRLHWSASMPKLGGRNNLAAFQFDNGWLWLTEAGTQRRAAMHLCADVKALDELNAGGIEPLEASAQEFAAALRATNHTAKRALTDPHIISGIGNAYSDEILFRAQLSPVAMTQKLTEIEITRLYDATQAVLTEWIEQLRSQAGREFPEKVTAFHPEMAVHGRYGLPCPVCGAKIQRIRFASNETNYCARCQNAGRLLADRALSRLMHEDWPRTLEELENRRN